MKQVRWGVVGCGQISFDRAMPAITNAPNATLVSVADVSEERLGLARTKFPGIQTYTAYADLLAAQGDGAVDAIYIGLPNQLHHPVAVAAAKAGKHVLCEKPISIDAKEALEMANACYENGVKLMGAYMSRFGDPFREAKRVIEGGKLGQIAMVNANFSFAAWRGYTLDKPGSWRWTGKRGGPLLDAGIYIAFAIRELLGSRVKRVSADIRTVVAKEFPAADTVVAWFELENGVPGVYTTTYSHADSYFAVHGTNGTLVMDNAFAQRPSGTVTVRAGHYQLDYKSDISLIDHNENYRREVEHFSDAILNGTPHSPSAQEALEDMTLLDAIEESATQGRIVELAYATVKG